MTDIFNTIADAVRASNLRLYEKPQLHNSVQLPHALQTATDYTIFLEKGHKIKVVKGEIVNCDTVATHEVDYFLGLGGGEFECHLTDLITGGKIIVRI